MAEKYHFEVEGHKFESPEKLISAGDIIRQAQEAGLEAAKGDIDKITLKGNKRIYPSKEWVNLSEDNLFAIGGPAYNFKVNGQELQSAFEKLVASDIIKMAIEHGAVAKGEYQLKGNVLYNENDWVDLSNETSFVLLPQAPTPVAEQ